MTGSSFLAFAGLSLVLAITPGPDTFLVLRFSLSRPAVGIVAGLGCALGSMGWALAVALGLGTLLEQSADAFRILKIIGGLYLVYLGVMTLVRSRKSRAQDGELTMRRTSLWGGFAAGVLSTMTNPKVGLFFLAIAPQFVPRHGSVIGTTLLLGAIDSVVCSVYLIVVAQLAGRMVAWLKRPVVMTWMERGSGTILAGLGIGTIALSAES